MFLFDFHWQIQNILNQFWHQINFLLLILLVILGYLSWKKPIYAAGLVIILLPTYLFRSKIWFLPFTYLELCIWTIFIITFTKSLLAKNYRLGAADYKLKWPILVILFASTISVFISQNISAAAGIWKAYFIEPIMFYLILINVIKNSKDKKIILWSLGISTLVISFLAIFQKFTGFAIAEPGWTGQTSRRVTSIFTSPNAVGLYLGPIIIIYFGWIIQEIKNYKATILKLLIFIPAILAIIFTISQGTWLGLLAGILFFVFFLQPGNKKIGWNKKLIVFTFLLLLITSLILPITREKIWPIITFQNHSGQNRLTLWQMSTDYLLSSPKNFILGAGLTGFSVIQNQLREPLKMEPLLYPHNIFLNFWLEIGLLGLIGFIWLSTKFFKHGFTGCKLTASRYKLIALGILSAMFCLLIHGLIDVPYFKNDLAILFWILIALI